MSEPLLDAIISQKYTKKYTKKSTIHIETKCQILYSNYQISQTHKHITPYKKKNETILSHFYIYEW